jgi:UDP-N-acetylglucosamine/UDP-N-acetylgalactosamine diphosphorylase
MSSQNSSEGFKQRLLSELVPFGQEHLLRFWDELDADQRQQLAEQIGQLDLALIHSLACSQALTDNWSDLAARAEEPPAITLADFANDELFDRASEAGENALRAGQVAMILVAGGQGTRLGFDRPKGMYPIGPLSGRTLYQILIEHLLARARQFETRIPLYVMCSPATHTETIEYFQQHQNFGLDQDDLKTFCQGTMPAIDFEGKLILEEKHRLFASPDGHGGMLSALAQCGGLDEMIARGIKHIFYAQVDNPLVQVCHPALLGSHLSSRSEMTTQVVRKTNPLQRVGNVVKVDGQVRIIEYSDFPESEARKTKPDGSLKYWAGSIAVHIFETHFLTRCLANQEALPFHRAVKKVPFVDESGKTVQPIAPNAIKFERFIFDLLPWAENAMVCEVDPAEGFCAVKNAAPAASETPEHVKQAISNLHRQWLQQAGADVSADATVEINPLFAVDSATLSQRIEPGFQVVHSTYFENPDHRPHQ